jgi:hypothetical protein
MELHQEEGSQLHYSPSFEEQLARWLAKEEEGGARRRMIRSSLI